MMLKLLLAIAFIVCCCHSKVPKSYEKMINPKEPQQYLPFMVKVSIDVYHQVVSLTSGNVTL